MKYYILKIDSACEEMSIEEINVDSFDEALDMLEFRRENDYYVNSYSLLTEEMYNDLISGKIKIHNR